MVLKTKVRDHHILIHSLLLGLKVYSILLLLLSNLIIDLILYHLFEFVICIVKIEILEPCPCALSCKELPLCIVD